MKKLLSLIVLIVAGIAAWNMWSSRTSSVSLPALIRATPTPSTSLPSRTSYLGSLTGVRDKLMTPISPSDSNDVNVMGELENLWNVGRLMYQDGALTQEEAQTLTDVIDTLRKIQEQRNLSLNRMKSLQLRHKERNINQEKFETGLTFDRVQKDWITYARTQNEMITQSLRSLE
jgi:hypothetical protein